MPRLLLLPALVALALGTVLGPALPAQAQSAPGTDVPAPAHIGPHLTLVPVFLPDGSLGSTVRIVTRGADGVAHVEPALRIPRMPTFALACYASDELGEHLADAHAEASGLRTALAQALAERDALLARLAGPDPRPSPEPPVPPVRYAFQRFASGQVVCRDLTTGRLAAQAFCRDAGALLPP